jgi:hypothetical protein
MASLNDEAGTAVVEYDAGSRAYDAGSEIVEDRVDERDRIAIGINDRDESCVPVIWDGEGGHILHTASHRYTCTQLRRALAQE